MQTQNQYNVFRLFKQRLIIKHTLVHALWKLFPLVSQSSKKVRLRWGGPYLILEIFRLESDKDLSTRFDLRFFLAFCKKIDTQECFISLLFTWNVSTYLYWRRLSSRHYEIFSKTRHRMTTAITFSLQNGAGSRARTTQYWENFVLVVVIVVESKDLYYGFEVGAYSRKFRQTKARAISDKLTFF